MLITGGAKFIFRIGRHRLVLPLLSVLVCAGQTGVPAAPTPGDVAAAARLAKMPESVALAEVGANSPPLTAGVSLALGRMTSRSSSRNLEDSLRLFRLALEIAERIGDRRQIVKTLINTGTAHHMLENFEAAMETYRSADSIARELGDPDLQSALAAEWSLTLRAIGDYQQALELNIEACRHLEASGDKSALARALVNLGKAYRAVGDYRLALDSYRKGLALAEEMKLTDGIGIALHNIGVLYAAQGDDSLAGEYLERSLKVKRKAGDDYRTASTLNSLGVLQFQRGDLRKSADLLKRAYEVSELAGRKSLMAASQANLALVEAQAGNRAEARRLLEESVRLSGSGGNKWVEGRALRALGEHLLETHDIAGSLDPIRNALEIARDTGDTDLQTSASTLLGAAMRRLDRPAEARAALNDSIAGAERARSFVAGGERELEIFFSHQVSPYHELLELEAAQGHPAEAFRAAELAKSRALLDVLKGGRASIDKVLTPRERDGERNLRRRLNTLNMQLASGRGDAAHVRDLTSRLESARRDQAAFQTGLYAAHSELRVKRGEASPATLAEVARLLPDNATAAIEFAVCEESLYAFLIRRGGRLQIRRIPVTRAQLLDQTSDLRKRLAARDLEYEPGARALYDLLLAPFQSELNGVGALIVVPDGPLWQVPLEALIDKEGRFLVETATVFYTPSLSVLLEMRKGAASRSARPSTLLLFGDPEGNLPETRREVAALQALYGAANLRARTGKEAREDVLKREAGRYDVIQITAHGIFDSRSPLYSHLLLNPSGDEQEDGLLEAWELMNIELRARLVILSGCETARGRVDDGEGLIGMSWALFVAGAPASIASEWRVGAASTTELMLALHTQLRRPVAGGAALAMAKRKLLASGAYRHPYYWAAFVLIGDGL